MDVLTRIVAKRRLMTPCCEQMVKDNIKNQFKRSFINLRPYACLTRVMLVNDDVQLHYRSSLACIISHSGGGGVPVRRTPPGVSCPLSRI